MEQFLGWNGLQEIMTEEGSQKINVDLKSSGLILCSISRAIYQIHNLGFVIGDLNPSNILFKQEGNIFNIKIIDVDSWSIYRKDDLGIEYSSNVLDTEKIYHYDFVKADIEGKLWPNFKPYHDWWAFSCICWMALTKYDPFMNGMVSGADREERILNNHTANSAATVELHPDCGPVTQALGPKLRFYLDKSLKRKTLRPFPTKLLEDFSDAIFKCKNCNFSTHSSAVICPSCGTLI